MDPQIVPGAAGLHQGQPSHSHGSIPSTTASASNFGYPRQIMHHSDQDDCPLRILVGSEMVGAIIGRSGNTIKQIIHQTDARIDVHRDDSVDRKDKVITIQGTLSSCSNACYKIMQIVANESALNNKGATQDNNDNNHLNNDANNSTSSDTNNNNNGHGNDNETTTNNHNQQDTNDHGYSDSSLEEVQLRILARNNLIGRLIGKSGVFIKGIMEQTRTLINISSNSVRDSSLERTITVSGSLDCVHRAQKIISKRLRDAYMFDYNSSLQAIDQQSYLFNNVPMPYLPGPYQQRPLLTSLVNPQPGHPLNRQHMGPGQHHRPMSRTIYPSIPGYPPLYPNMGLPPQSAGLMGYGPGTGGFDHKIKENVHIYIPNNMVGAIIGKSGSAIKEMIVNSGANIKVAATPIYPTDQSTHINVDDSSKVEAQHGEEPLETSDQQNATPEQTNEHSNSQASKAQSGVGHNIQANQPSNDDNTSKNIAQNSNQNHHHRNHNMSAAQDKPLRKISIVGSPDSLWSAQYFIYRKVSIESGTSDISLMVEIMIPYQLVGKIIGKGGTNIKKLQAQSCTSIRLPSERPSTATTEADELIETPVQIYGVFQNSQLAQRLIRNLIREGQQSISRHVKSQHSKGNHISSSATTEVDTSKTDEL